ncbi:hypothetical protein [Bradyrhizobium sp. STM 3561]|uniref:hypothetical protein n=1 Tax=Bradyrhizobium sp. STM 3561 TaxID=578923 RepID=UPI00388F7BBB
MSNDVKINIDAQIDTGDVDAQIAKVTERLNRLGQSVAAANRVKFHPIDRATLDDIRKVQAAFESIKRLSPNLAADLKRMGQGSTHFADVDLLSLSQNKLVASARAYGLFNKVAAGTAWAGSMQQSAAGSTGGRPPAPPSPPSPSSPGASWGWGGAGRRIVGAGLNAAGPVGQALNGGISAGMSAGVMAGVGGFVGMLGAALVGKAVGAIKEKVGDAQNDSIGYDTLKRTLGDVNVSFEALQRSLHAASDGVDITYVEARKLGTEFAKISGSNNAKSLAEEVLNGGAFGRSFGIDPGQSNAFFAQMRQFGVTRDAEGSRRLALDIGEAIAKSGAFSKADEMLQAIASYTTQQTRLGLTAANSTGYAGMLAGLVGSHTPGLDPQGAANLLARVNSAIANGGSAGEAGQNFLYMALGRRLGLNPIQSKILQEQGAFGSGAGAFGSGSLYAKWAAQNGLAVLGAAGSGETNLEMTLKALRLSYANPMLRLSAMSNLLGVNTSQSMALDSIGSEKLGSLQRALAANGIDLSKMSGTGISALAQIASGGRDVLNAQAKALWGQLSPDEAARLDKAGQGGDEGLRKALLELTAKYGQERTEGEQTRESINKLDKTTQDAAAKMIGPLNTMRDTLLYAFGDRGRMTAADMHKAVVDAQRQEVNDRYSARVKKTQASASMSVDEYGRTLPGQEAAMTAAQAEMNAAKAERDKALREIDAGETPATSSTGSNTASLPAWASSGSTAAASPGAATRRATNPGNIRYGDFARRYGAIGQDGSGFAVFPDAATGTAAMQALLRSYGERGLNTVGGVVGRWAPPSENDTSSYAKAVAKRLGVGVDAKLDMRNPAVVEALGREMAKQEGNAPAYQPRSMYSTPMPDGASRMAQQAPQEFTFTHELKLQDPSGKPIAPLSVVSTRVAKPSPSGVAN